jgi:hypothetical protein
MTSSGSDYGWSRVATTEKILSIIVKLAKKVSNETIGADLHALPAVAVEVPALSSHDIASMQTLSMIEILFRITDSKNATLPVTMVAALVLDIMRKVAPVERPQIRPAAQTIRHKLAIPKPVEFIPEQAITRAIVTPPSRLGSFTSNAPTATTQAPSSIQIPQAVANLSRDQSFGMAPTAEDIHSVSYEGASAPSSNIVVAYFDASWLAEWEEFLRLQ